MAMFNTKDPAFNGPTSSHRLQHQSANNAGNDDDDEEPTSVAAEAASSTGSSSGGDGGMTIADPTLIRTFAPDAPLPWATFNRLRKQPFASSSNAKDKGSGGGGGGASSGVSPSPQGSSTGSSSSQPPPPPTLTAMQETNVLKAVNKVKQGEGNIGDAHPFVSAFMDKHCPDIKPRSRSGGGSGGGVQGPRDGATFLLLAVVTGNAQLLKACLDLGANPNDTRFFGLKDAPPNYMRHGFTPFFMACICDQVDVMAALFERGASLHIFDRWGRTPLHAAAGMGNQSATDWLLAHGAPRLVADRSAFRPGEAPAAFGQQQQQQQQQRTPPKKSSASSSAATNGEKKKTNGAKSPPLSPANDKASSSPSTMAIGASSPTPPPPIAIPPREPGVHHVFLRPESAGPPSDCPCGSGRKMGVCGCVDDMHTRWYGARASACWVPREIMDGISSAQSKYLKERHPFLQ